MDLCGHATIATFYAMSSLHLLKQGKYKQETLNISTSQITADLLVQVISTASGYYGSCKKRRDFRGDQT